jgi:hypothetical protein
VFEIAAKVLLVYGPLGAVCVISMLMTTKLYRDLIAERKAHSEEMRAFQERYITKADTWMSQYHELQKRMADLVEAMSKRRG